MSLDNRRVTRVPYISRCLLSVLGTSKTDFCKYYKNSNRLVATFVRSCQASYVAGSLATVAGQRAVVGRFLTGVDLERSDADSGMMIYQGVNTKNANVDLTVEYTGFGCPGRTHTSQLTSSVVVLYVERNDNP